MISTHLKNISQIGSFPQVGVKIENISNHHLGETFRNLHLQLWKKYTPEDAINVVHLRILGGSSQLVSG